MVLFSVTKGFAAMAMALLADRGKIDLDAPAADYWPGFPRAGKADTTGRMLLCPRAGLPYLDQKLTLDDCVDPAWVRKVTEPLEAQRPAWTPGEKQGYHAITFGLYVREAQRR